MQTFFFISYERTFDVLDLFIRFMDFLLFFVSSCFLFLLSFLVFILPVLRCFALIFCFVFNVFVIIWPNETDHFIGIYNTTHVAHSRYFFPFYSESPKDFVEVYAATFLKPKCFILPWRCDTVLCMNYFRFFYHFKCNFVKNFLTRHISVGRQWI